MTIEALDLLVFFGVPLLAFAIIIFDVVMKVKYGTQGTISYWLQQVGYDWPLVPFAIGFFSGGLICGLAVHLWNFMKD
jgi:hypothetical protein